MKPRKLKNRALRVLFTAASMGRTADYSGQSNVRDGEYLPIEDYGLIGNLNTTALVSKTDASIDFMCYPYADSPTIFGRLLDAKRGGFFQISPLQKVSRSKQLYFPSSNVLLTRFNVAGGIGQVTDLLPLTLHPITGIHLESENIHEITHELLPWLIRKVEVIRGSVEFEFNCQPAFDYGRISHNIEITSGNNVLFTNNHMDMDLRYVSKDGSNQSCPKAELIWDIVENNLILPNGKKLSQPTLNSKFQMCEKESIIFVFRRLQPKTSIGEDGTTGKCLYFLDPPISYNFLQNLINETNIYWHSWISKCTYKGRWREIVQRSALALKLLTFQPTGAILASPTFSLPEEIGGGKNWDYRFTWIRDAAFTVYAFMRIGLTDEATKFMKWIEKRCRDLQTYSANHLHILYDVQGGHPSFDSELLEESRNRADGVGRLLRPFNVQHEEIELDHWCGYKNSRPVRIGNAASGQKQLDIYGELMDAIYLCDKYCAPISYDFWNIIKEHVVGYVCEHWKDPDQGIWEVRGPPRHYVYSKVMSWVCIDRAIRLASKRSMSAPLEEWTRIRNEIYDEVMTRGWNDELQCFVQHYDSRTLDASNLIMPLVFFISPNDPRFLSTLEKTMKPIDEGGLTVNNLVFRYNIAEIETEAGMSGEEGTFSMCTFWLTEALARAGNFDCKYLNESLFMFEDMIGYANHLGLFSEEIDLSGQATGNFPQAFTHLALISAAFNIDRAMH